jgi:hypothetical protein
MVRHVPLHRNPKLYEEHYCNQSGHGLPIFIGGRSQRGRGLGSFFSGIGRMVMPWLKTGGKALLREGMGTGIQVARDALAGRDAGESFKEHAKAAGQRLLEGAADHLGGNQSGSGFRRRRLPPGEVFRKTLKRAGGRLQSHNRAKTVRKHHSDIFG